MLEEMDCLDCEDTGYVTECSHDDMNEKRCHCQIDY